MSAARVDRPPTGPRPPEPIEGRALVLTAGHGRRLHPLTSLRAKPAVPVAGQPLIRRILGWLASQQVRDIVLNLHHRPDSLAAVVGDGSDLGVRVRYSWEQPLLGSAGGPRHALPLIDADRFWIVNGDTLAAVDLAALARAHARSGALVTMALVPNPRPAHYGGVLVEDDWVTGFAAGSADRAYHFVGVQLAESRVFADLADGAPAESVSGVYRALLAAAPRSIRAAVCDVPFHDIGTPADYLHTSLELARAEGLGETLPAGARSRVSPDARLTRTVVWDDVMIEGGAVLVDCVVGDRVRIPAGRSLTRRVIVPAACADPRPGDAVVGDLLITPLGEDSQP